MLFDPTGCPPHHFSVQYSSPFRFAYASQAAQAVTDMINIHLLETSQIIYGQLSYTKVVSNPLHGNWQAWKVGFQSSLKFWFCFNLAKPCHFVLSFFLCRCKLSYKAMKTLLHVPVVIFFSFVSYLSGIVRKIWLLITQKTRILLLRRCDWAGVI